MVKMPRISDFILDVQTIEWERPIADVFEIAY